MSAVLEAARFQLPELSAAEVELSNWGHTAFADLDHWSSRLRASLGSLLERPAGETVRVTARHTLDATLNPVTAVMSGGSLTIGRKPTCEMVLPESSIHAEHARLTIQGGAVLLEDLGSRLGTFVGDRKLDPHSAARIAPGVPFTLFPYSVRVEIERQWLAEDRIGLLAGRRSVTNWGAFQATRQPGVLLLGIRLGAADYIAAIELSHGLTEALLEGLLGLDRPEAAGYLQTDWGCLEFLFGRLCEGLGRPFLLEREVATALPAAEIGLAIELVTSIRDRQGMVRIFLPERSRHALTLEPVPCRRSPRAIPWQARIELAAIELSGQEAQSLRPGDVVLILPDPVARLGSSPFGFRLELSDSNFSTLRADKQVERLIRLDTSSALQSLPLSLQVILAEREFTLADLEKLGAGTVIELGRDESSPVQLALNGKLMGTGTLVRIEGHLGVRVVGWAGDE